MKILIVSTFFPPENSIASLRPYSWAKWWSRMGHDVTVLTTPKPQRNSNMDMSYDGFKVHEIPIPFLSNYRSHKAAVDSSFAQMNYQQNKKPWYVRSVFSFVKKYGIFSSCRFPDFTDLWAPRASKWAASQKWDLVVSTGWPYSTHRVGLAIKKGNSNTKWIVDWRDLWVDNHIYPGLPILKNYERFLEKKFHEYTDLITTVSVPLADKLKKLTNKKVEVVYNGFDYEDYNDLSSENFFPKDDVIRILYTGSIYKGKQDPSPLFYAIAELKKTIGLKSESLKVYFAGANSDVSTLARKCDVDEFCDYLGFLPRKDTLRAQRDADVLLFLEFESPGVKGVLTGKIFEYLISYKFILGVGATKKTSSGRLIIDTGHGLVVGKDVEYISQLIEDWLVNGKPAILSSETSLVNSFSRKIQAEAMLLL